jgi:hypothetical protein
VTYYDPDSELTFPSEDAYLEARGYYDQDEPEPEQWQCPCDECQGLGPREPDEIDWIPEYPGHHPPEGMFS